MGELGHTGVGIQSSMMMSAQKSIANREGRTAMLPFAEEPIMCREGLRVTSREK